MYQNYLVEFFATALFIYVVLSTGNPLAIGACLALIILITRSVSEGMLNPVITIVMASAGQIPVNEVVPLSIAQVLGGLVALEIYKRTSYAQVITPSM
jgi:glycerol uptake facilitator-like aquaporin